jgi:integrase
MATLRKRGQTWQVQIRRLGYPSISRSFHLRVDAETWARKKEAEADRGHLTPDPKLLQSTTFANLLELYRGRVLERANRPMDTEHCLVRSLLKHPVSRVTLFNATPSHFSEYRDERSAEVKPGTLVREFGLIQRVFEVARREWGYPLTPNPIAEIRMPVVKNARDRRLKPGELERILAATDRCFNKLMEPIIRFAIETGMRRSEITSLRWSDYDRDAGTFQIREAKNGYPRTIPLSGKARRILENLESNDCERVFPVSTNAINQSWQRIKKRARVESLRFHDLRHEAVSRFFEKGLSVPEVALISGHRDLRMLHRYTHLKVETIVPKLN